ncbi:MAG: transglutaminase-like domain-containing protein [Oscillospiraceae bacterium]|nr:transglutaminase-like domain-containing protein [Oscillospiraceae bacterium]
MARQKREKAKKNPLPPKTTSERVADVLLALCYCLPLAYAVLSHVLLEPNPVLMVFYLAVFLVMWTLMFVSWRNAVIAQGIVVGTVLLIILYNLAAGRLDEFFQNCGGAVVSFLEDMWWESIPLTIHKGFLTGFTACVIAFFAAIFSRRSRFLPLGLLGMGVYLWEWLYGYESNNALFFIFLLTMAVYYMKKVNIRLFARSKLSAPSRLYPLTVAPLALAVIIAAFMIPSAAEPGLQANYIHEIATGQIESLTDLIAFINAPDSFQFHRTGFTKRDGTIGGDIQPNSAPVLELSGLTGLGSNRRVYLAGGYRDTFTGNAWKNTHTGWEEDGTLLEETVNVREHLFFLEDNPREMSVTVKPLVMQKVLFVPQYTYGEAFARQYAIEKSGAVAAKSPSKSPYKLTFTLPEDAGIISPIALRFREIGPGYYQRQIDEWEEQYAGWNVGYRPEDRRIGELRLFNDNAAAVRQRYTQLPEGITERTLELARELILDADCELSMAEQIRNYFTDFTYTLTPGEVPEGRDLVDYFLFDHREGYCTYFASAMSVLCRSVGLPTRYVEGYSSYAEPGIRGKTTVTNESAHAWVEVYLEGFGWYMLDPTASHISAPAPSVPSATYPSGNSTTAPTPPTGPTLPTEPSVTQPQPGGTRISLLVWLLPVAVILAAGLTAAGIWWIAGRRFRRIQKMPPLQAAPAYFIEILQLLRRDGVKIRAGETANQLGRRLDSAYRFDIALPPDDPEQQPAALSVGLAQIAEIYAWFVYANTNAPANAEDRIKTGAETVKQYTAALRQRVKKRLGVRGWLI